MMKFLKLPIEKTVLALIIISIMVMILFFASIGGYFIVSSKEHDVLEEISTIATIIGTLVSIIGTIITIVALYLAYLAFQDQKTANDINSSSLVSNAIQSKINRIRDALDSTFYDSLRQQNRVEYGIRAATLFIEEFDVPTDNTPNPGFQNGLNESTNTPRLEFANEILSQLEFVVDTVDEIQRSHNLMSTDDFRQIDGFLRGLINLYIRKYDEIFRTAQSSIRQLTLKDDDWRFDQIEGFLRIVEKRNTLAENLESKGYLERIFAFDLSQSSMIRARRVIHRRSNLQRRLTNLIDVKFYKSI